MYLRFFATGAGSPAEATSRQFLACCCCISVRMRPVDEPLPPDFRRAAAAPLVGRATPFFAAGEALPFLRPLPRRSRLLLFCAADMLVNWGSLRSRTACVATDVGCVNNVRGWEWKTRWVQDYYGAICSIFARGRQKREK